MYAANYAILSAVCVPVTEGVTTPMPRDVCHDEPREYPLPWSVRPCEKHHGRTDLPCYRVRDADGEIVPGAVVLVRMLVQEERAREAEDKLLSMREYLNDGNVQGARDLVSCVSPKPPHGEPR